MYSILVSKNQRYSCKMCGRCCRRFNVRIEEHEVQRLQALDWGNTPHPVDFYEKINGYYYFKRQPDGGCVFLNDQGVCSIHAKFGFDAKALTCRGYPMNIISVAPNELSVLARMDCPAVLENNGEPLVKAQRDIMQLVSEMTFGNGFDDYERDGLTRESLDFICKDLHKIVRDKQLPLPRRILWMLNLAAQCRKLGAPFINDTPTLKTVWLNLMKKSAVMADSAKPHGTINSWKQLMFRAWLAFYCRRDEECVSRNTSARLRNFRSNAGFIFGYAPWKNMGFEHPDISSKKARLFAQKLGSIGDDDTWKPYLDFLVNRLDTFQFFGAAYYNLSFYKGLQALLLTFPLALATAKVHAAAQGRTTIQQQDVFNAVLSIDHCHGRSPILNSVKARFYENTFAANYLELIQTLTV